MFSLEDEQKEAAILKIMVILKIIFLAIWQIAYSFSRGIDQSTPVKQVRFKNDRDAMSYDRTSTSKRHLIGPKKEEADKSKPSISFNVRHLHSTRLISTGCEDLTHDQSRLSKFWLY